LGFIKNSRLAQAGIAFLVIVACCYIWKSDFFQKAAFPEKYWQKQVSALVKTIEFNEVFIRSAYRDIEKIQLTAQLDITDNIDSAEMLGMTKDAAIQDAEEEIKEDIEANRELIKEMSDTNSKLKQEMEQAKKGLTRHRKTR
jgi:hypothetical protein